MQVGKRKKWPGAANSVPSEELGRAGGPRGLVKQQGKNVLDAGMVYWLQTDKQRGRLCHQFMFYWNCQYRGGAPAGFSQWRAAWCSLDKVTCSADLARSLFSAEPNSWDLWRSLLFLRTWEHLYRVACCSSKSGRTIFQRPLHSESWNSQCLKPEGMWTQKRRMFVFDDFLRRQMLRPWSSLKWCIIGFFIRKNHSRRFQAPVKCSRTIETGEIWNLRKLPILVGLFLGWGHCSPRPAEGGRGTSGLTEDLWEWSCAHLKLQECWEAKEESLQLGRTQTRSD